MSEVIPAAATAQAAFECVTDKLQLSQGLGSDMRDLRVSIFHVPIYFTLTEDRGSLRVVAWKYCSDCLEGHRRGAPNGYLCPTDGVHALDGSPRLGLSLSWDFMDDESRSDLREFFRLMFRHQGVDALLVELLVGAAAEVVGAFLDEVLKCRSQDGPGSSFAKVRPRRGFSQGSKRHAHLMAELETGASR